MNGGVISLASCNDNSECDYHQLYVLLWNCIGAVAIVAWTATTSGVMFASLKYSGMLRVDEDTEVRGLDLKKHGVSAYPKDRLIITLKNTLLQT